MRFLSIILSVLFQYHILAIRRLPFPLPASITSSPPPPPPSQHDHLAKRQITSQISTCGYDDGNPSKPRTANGGFNCRVDTRNDLWGFCPTTVISASDCGLAGNCIDNHACTSGCGIFGTAGITTFTCTASDQGYCSTALLIDGPDQTYSYIACAAVSGVESLFANPTFTTTAAASSSRLLNPSKPPSLSVLSTLSTASSSAISLTTKSPSSAAQSRTSSTSSTSSNPSASASSTSAASLTASAASAASATSKTTLGSIIGGVIGSLALICILILGVLYLRRHPPNHQIRSTVAPPPDYTTGMSEQPPGTQFGGGYWRYGGYGPSELPTKREREPVELG